jgi:hypothetical protein
MCRLSFSLPLAEPELEPLIQQQPFLQYNRKDSLMPSLSLQYAAFEEDFKDLNQHGDQ